MLDRTSARPRSVRRAKNDAAELPRFRRRGRPSVYQAELAARVVDGPGRPPAADAFWKRPRRSASARWACRRNIGGVELEQGTEVQHLRDDRRGDRARRFRTCRQAGAELEGLCAAAQVSRRNICRKSGSSGSSPIRSSCWRTASTEPRGASDRWLPYNVPEAAMQTQRGEDRTATGSINGRKQFISNGYDAGLFVVYANTNPKVGMLQGTSSFLVPRDTPGLHGRALQRDARLPLHEQRRDWCSRTCACRTIICWSRTTRSGHGRRLFPPGKIIQAAKNLGVGVRALRGHRRLRAELRAGRRVS